MKNKKGIALMAMMAYAIIAATGATATPVVYDQFAGAETMPDSTFHFLELAGENIRCAVAVDKSNCYLNLVQERTMELAYIQTRLQSMTGEEKEQYEALAERMQQLATQSEAEANKYANGG